jgi:periplasmic protein TonB
MFVSFEQMRPVFRNYRRSPYARVLLIVVAVHLVMFVLTPPFHFKPYTVAAQDTITVVRVPEYIPPPEPDKEPPSPYVPDPFPDPVAPDRDPFDSSPADFDSLLKIRTTESSPQSDWKHWDKDPEPTKLVRPLYPDLARQAGIEGVVMVLVTIGVDGKVVEASILSSEVTEAMDRAALAAARLCRFTPVEQQGKKVKVTVMIPFQFRLSK